MLAIKKGEKSKKRKKGRKYERKMKTECCYDFDLLNKNIVETSKNLTSKGWLGKTAGVVISNTGKYSDFNHLLFATETKSGF